MGRYIHRSRYTHGVNTQRGRYTDGVNLMRGGYRDVYTQREKYMKVQIHSGIDTQRGRYM